MSTKSKKNKRLAKRLSAVAAAASGSLMDYEDGCKAIHAKMQAERPTLREYLRQMCVASDKASHEWGAAHPGCHQAAYRNGMWYAYRDIERMMERDGFNSENVEVSQPASNHNQQTA